MILDVYEDDDLPLAKGAHPEAPSTRPHVRGTSPIRLILLGALAWALVAWVVVPLMRTDGVPAVPRWDARWLYLYGPIAAGGAGLALWATTRRTFVRRFVGRATPGTLGALRAYVCAILAVMTYLEQAHSLPNLPESHRLSMGVIDLLYEPLGLGTLARSATGLAAMKAVTIAVLLVGAVGWKTWYVLPVAAVLWLVFAGLVRSYLRFTHNGLVPFYLLVILCFTPCAEGFSLDRLARLWRGQPVVPAARRSARYAWGRFAVWVGLALPYVMAGMSKLRFGGPTWWEPANMQELLYRNAFRPFDRGYDVVLSLASFPPVFFGAMGVLTLVTELGMGLAPFWRPARRVMPVMSAGMHLGILVLQRIRFWDMMALQLVYYDWSRPRRWVGRKLAGRWGRVEVRFDPRDDRQARWARVLPAVDLFDLVDASPDPGATRLRVRRRGVRVVEEPARNAIETSARRRRNVRPAPAWAGPVGVSVLSCAVLGGWALKSEWFPLTSMTMYASHNDSGVVRYFRVYQTDAGGTTRVAHLDKLAPQSRNFHLTLWQSFGGPRARAPAANLLRYCATHHNASAPPERRIVAMEVVLRRWDFVRDRHGRTDGEPGQVLDRLTVPIPASPAGRPEAEAYSRREPEPASRSLLPRAAAF